MRHLVFALAVALMLVSPAAGADVGIQAYELPKGGGYPHDVAVGADGIVWYTAQRDGKLGRVDRPTGSERRRTRTGTTRRWPAATSPAWIWTAARRRSASRLPGTRARAACGRPRRAGSG